VETIKSNFSHVYERREEFPSLKRRFNDFPLAYFDGPGGSQVPRQVLEAMNNYYMNSNANSHGAFVTSEETDLLLEAARDVTATFLGAESSRCISFGANMTTLNFSLSRAIGRYLEPGDEILISQLDHEANRQPWLALRELGIVVREVRITDDYTLDYNDLEDKLNEDTRLIAVGFSSNAFGTVNDIPRIRELAYQVGAWVLVDAVHYAPHFPLDVKALGVDFLLCSAYKFYGPHVGILYAREGLLNRLPTDRLRTQEQMAPYCIETGTLNHAAIAGVKAAVEYIATFGQGDDLRAAVVKGMEDIAAHEEEMAEALYDGLSSVTGLTLVGPSMDVANRAPTVSFTIDGVDPVDVCRRLGEKGICSWDGHFYAIRPMEVLGLLERGGVTRLGISLYNTPEEVERVVSEVRNIGTR
jgi:cysteine desulfurase family protein (TIGR01976 family)